MRLPPVRGELSPYSENDGCLELSVVSRAVDEGLAGSQKGQRRQ